MIRKKGKSLCIFSAKGGVGKTITTLNLAGIFKLIEKKVLIMDMDLANGGVTVALNCPFTSTIYNFVDDYNNNRYKEFKNYVTKYDEFIDILPSPKDPRQESKIDSKYIEIALDKALYNYDIVLIDTTHDLNEQNLVTMDIVDEILFVMTNDPLDLKNMKSLLSIFRDLEKTNYKILLNNSRDPYKKYFSIFDIRSIIKANIDYTLSSEFFLKNIDQYIMNGKIITLEPKMPNVFAKDYSVLMTIAADITKEEEEKNEKK
ncbi:MAG: AAA family ATPase [Bacilli bacterium]|nr:AAA family ATPase [Bacilli bacterium]